MAARRSAPCLEALEDRQLLSTGLQLRLAQPGFNPLVVHDNGPGDANPQDGVIVFNGAYGTFHSNFLVGARVSAHELVLSGSSLSVSGGALDIILGDTDFLPDGASRLTGSAGSFMHAPTGGSVAFQTWVNPDNVVDLVGDAAVEIGPLGQGGNYGGVAEAVVEHGQACAIVSRAQIVLGGYGVVAFGYATDMSSGIDSGVIDALTDDDD